MTGKRKTSMTLDAEVLDEARELGLNVSAITDAALRDAVAKARREQWVRQNADAFAAQANWHETHGHPLADILATPAQTTWKS